MADKKEMCCWCEYARKRTEYDLKRNGNRGFPYECLMNMDDREEYKMAVDWCPLFKGKE